MRQLDWAEGAQAAGKALSPSVSVRALLEETGIWSGGPVQICPRQWGGCRQSVEVVKRSQGGGRGISSLCPSWAVSLLLPSGIRAPGSWDAE